IQAADDDDNDLMILKMALTNTGVTNHVKVATNGQAVMDYFQDSDKIADRSESPYPYLVLLDLKLTYVMGLDVLAWIRAQPQFESTIVIVLTSSRHTHDIRTAYELGANAYLVKPADLNALERMVGALKDFWVGQNTPPPV